MAEAAVFAYYTVYKDGLSTISYSTQAYVCMVPPRVVPLIRTTGGVIPGVVAHVLRTAGGAPITPYSTCNYYGM